ncbi:hypothetical protein GCM10009555_053970 [Acrocarpospora macrocephala]|uniref:REase associating with pPIWI RE domain-containing protein n=2 Tax=Acrocarpospora macrocephala TaxID=150177 RepID=A0A5M3WSE8_9ACTN|nr:hypothetical protein Amac_046890 [Acrocarpospora macrocephala]
MAAQALTDNDRPPDRRLGTLMEAHGQILAARGPFNPLSFSDFRDLLTQDLALLLPEDVPAEEMQGVHLITPDGQFDDDLYDLEQEQRLVLRTMARMTRGGQQASSDDLEAEMDQERAYTGLKKPQDQSVYVSGRKALIDMPAGPVGTVRKLPLPSSVAVFYQPIAYAATYDRWWFGCPICRWPMKISVQQARGTKTGIAECFHRPHRTFGAKYHFKISDTGAAPELKPASSAPSLPSGNDAVLFPQVRAAIPEATPVKDHVALTRGVWRWTTVPGLVEVAMYEALKARGLKPELWPDLDAYDLLVEVGSGRHKTTFRIDLKDYSHPILLAQKIQADEGDAGGADWLAVPDYRASSLPLLTRVCGEYGLNVATAGDLGAKICGKAGLSWV